MRANLLIRASPACIPSDAPAVKLAGRLPRLKKHDEFLNRAGSSRSGLFARCAGIHVDFHAHRHFDNLWSLPVHSNLHGFWRTMAPDERRTGMDV